MTTKHKQYALASIALGLLLGALTRAQGQIDPGTPTCTKKTVPKSCSCSPGAFDVECKSGHDYVGCTNAPLLCFTTGQCDQAIGKIDPCL